MLYKLSSARMEFISWKMSSATTLEIPKESSFGCKYKNESFFTSQDIRNLTDKTIGCDTEVVDYSVRPFSDGKLGFLGSHQRLCITAKEKNEEKIVCFFVKIIPYEVPTQAEYVLDRGVFDQETTFYNEIVPELQQNYRGEPWGPICYKVKKDLIVFEELTSKGFTIRKEFDIELISSGLSTIARLHAASLLAEEHLGERLNVLYPHAFKERAFGYTGKVRNWYEAGVKLAVAIAKTMNLDSSPIPKIMEEVYESVKPSMTKKNVVSHGDLWGNNLMFNNDMPPKCLLVDFQLSRYCTFAHDVTLFLYMCSTRTFRNTWMMSMLMHYYDVLCQTLEDNEYRAEKPSWSEIVRGYKEQRLGAAITAVLYLPTVLLDEELGAKIMNDPISYARHVFHDRDDAVLENMKRDREYGERLREAVVELLELAAQFDELPKPT